jgi:acyl-CoA synthetase (AMP-forming)/AMP-acid ligase II
MMMVPLHCRSLLQVRVVGDEGDEVAEDSGVVGEVQLRGPTLFDGYWRQAGAVTAGKPVAFS